MDLKLTNSLAANPGSEVVACLFRRNLRHWQCHSLRDPATLGYCMEESLRSQGTCWSRKWVWDV